MEPINTNGPYDLAETLWLLSMGPADPTRRIDSPTRQRLALQTPAGPAAFSVDHIGDHLHVAWLAGEEAAHASGLAERMPRFLGAGFRPPVFEPTAGKPSSAAPPRRLVHLSRKHAGMRLPCLPIVSGRLVQIILQQLVSFRDASAAWKQLAHRHGERVAGQTDLWYPPTPATLARLASHQWAECGVLPRFGRTIAEAMKHTARIEATWNLGDGRHGDGRNGERRNGDGQGGDGWDGDGQGDGAASADALCGLLAKLPGIGPWTLGFLRGAGLGDADALVPGDYSHPRHVARFFRGEQDSSGPPIGRAVDGANDGAIDRATDGATDGATDADMLELLEPYRPHRFYVLALLLKGFPPAPRKGPRRRSVRDRLG